MLVFLPDQGISRQPRRLAGEEEDVRLAGEPEAVASLRTLTQRRCVWPPTSFLRKTPLPRTSLRSTGLPPVVEDERDDVAAPVERRRRVERRQQERRHEDARASASVDRRAEPRVERPLLRGRQRVDELDLVGADVEEAEDRAARLRHRERGARSPRARSRRRAATGGAAARAPAEAAASPASRPAAREAHARGPYASFSRSSARAERDLTVPRAMSSAAAVSSSERSSR